jgi:putative ATP-binding cassette transporter
MTLFQLVLTRHQKSVLVACALSLASAGLSVGVLAFIEQRLLRTQSPSTQTLLLLIGLLALLFVVSSAAQLLMRKLGQRVLHDLRCTLAKRVLDSELMQVERVGAASLLASLSSDAEQISHALVSLPHAVYGTAVSLGAFAYLAWLSWPLFLSVALWIGLTVALASLMLARCEQWFTRSRDVEDALQESYQGLVYGHRELTLNRQRARVFYEQELCAHAESARSYGLRADSWAAINDSFVNVMALGAIGLALLIAATTGWASPAIAATYGFTLLFLGTPLAGVVSAIPSLIAGNVALRKIASLELAAYTATFSAPPSGLGDFRSLARHAVHYRYPKRDEQAPFEIGPIDLQLRRGELVFIVGGNGSGKSTLARLLCGLCEPSRGEVRVDGRALPHERIQELRPLTSTVFSDFHLFTQLLGPSGTAPESAVQRWLETLHLSHKASAREGRLSDTRLSAGQRKRLALLLALLEERPLILLDEWAADQDPSFRRLFYRELLPQLKAAGKTVVAITHDDHYFDVADRVLKMDGGRLWPLHAEARDAEPVEALPAHSG